MKKTIIRAALGAALCLASIGSSFAQISGDIVKIGMVNDLSGNYSDVDGMGGVEAVRMAIADFGGTVLGKKIEFVIADHQNKADIAATRSREWFDRDGVDMLIAGSNSATNLSMAKVAAEKKKVYFADGGATAR